MADDETDIGQLSPTQQEALQQYLAVTNQEVKDAVPLLQRSQWNVQIAIAKFFDGEGPDPLAEAMAADQAIPQVAARHENLQQSLLASEFSSRAAPRRDRTDPAPRIVPQTTTTTQGTPWLLGLLLTPLNWGWHAATVLLRTILYAASFLPAAIRPTMLTTRLSAALQGGGGAAGRRMLMPRDAAARFKREFDEEHGDNNLPFFEGGLAQAHDLAKKELKFLLVVLLSPEHDDTASFVRETLLAPDVAAFVRDPASNVVLWGGNVLDSEAFQVAREYKCTKFPFSALVCLTPREGSARMGIVKRLAGPMPPAAYLAELQGAVEKYGADMAGVRAERSAQEFARSLRDQQDSAYERSLAIDRERAREKREAAAAAAEKEKRALEEAMAASRRREQAALWRAWRAKQIRPEPPAGDKEVVRVALMMPQASGAGRITRRFAQDAPVEELYAFVECYDNLRISTGAVDGSSEGKPVDYEHKYMFRVASTLPRVVYEPSETATMGATIGRSGNLIVEELEEGADED
ncbi:UBX domain protein [Cordyceps fumosorosea ARSEF 2679]|uniref:UBX domain protein n=1 Tax=Cordyceps fumosorosea (strain ARSEF 2679) TaxID=1081104 RepID=A0A167SZF0_CORFA|nr:UBX domain protein [Cordyceps fumosorosea ARSEF 2679]OAA60088.1 UBX domain protein [Cordyceps fumosorosea ARSEF 2679]